MIRTVLFVVLAITTLTIDAAAIESDAPETARAKHDAWEIAWSVAMYENLAARRDESAGWDKWEMVPWQRGRSDAREVYGDAWVIYKHARAIYEADRERSVAAAGENYQFALHIYEDARMKYDAAYKAERAAKNAAARAARAIFETGRERNIAAWENYQTVLQVYKDAWTKREAAYKAERAARRAVGDAVREASHAARNAVKKANSEQD